MIDLGLWVSYILLFAAVAAMVIYSVINMLGDLKNAKGTLIGVGVLLGIFLISILFSSSEVLPKYEQLGISASQSRMIGAGLIMMYIVAVGTVCYAVFSEIRKIFIK